MPRKKSQHYVNNKEFLAAMTDYKNAVKKANRIMGSQGRILVRKSGTEPKIRIMAESYDKNIIFKCIKIIKKSLR